MTTPTYPKIR